MESSGKAGEGRCFVTMEQIEAAIRRATERLKVLEQGGAGRPTQPPPQPPPEPPGSKPPLEH